jgi:hypothetical protein
VIRVSGAKGKAGPVGFSCLRVAALAVVLSMIALTAVAAGTFQLSPYKDELFANPKPVQTMHGGTFRVVEYSVQRDLRDRDEVPEKKAKADYVSLDTKKAEQILTMSDGSGKTPVAIVGKIEGPATAIVIFLHGRGAGLKAGFDDWNFGGNFNRIKNLMMRSGGLYVSPSFANFDETGRAQIKGLMRALAKGSPDAPVFLACASAAGRLCTALAADKEAGPRLGGIIFLGANVKEIAPAAAQLTKTGYRIPVFIGHGSKDPVIDWVRQELFFAAIREATPDYPIRFTLYKPGFHGTPMRMVDWREVINWMLDVRGS